MHYKHNNRMIWYISFQVFLTLKVAVGIHGQKKKKKNAKEDENKTLFVSLYTATFQ